MGVVASCKPSNTSVNEIATRPSDDQQPRPCISGMKHGIAKDAGTSNIKQRVHFREEDDNNEYDRLWPQQQRQGLLPPIDNEQSHKSNIDQQTSKRNPNKRKPNEQKFRIKELEEEVSSLRSEITGLKMQHYDEMQTLKQEADDLKLRLSKVASDRLTDNNPNITDLSDENRAIKVGEKLSELYSNEWSDAYEELTEGGRRSDIQAINILLEILKIIFAQCKRKAEEEIHDIETNILACTGHSELNNELSAAMKLLRTERKRNFKATMSDFLTILEIFVPKEEESVTLQNYVLTTTETCWLMCIHEPPLTFKYCENNNKFNEDYFSPYTRTGDTVEFLVWPALLLHDGGPLLNKGVAQAKNPKQKEQKVQTKQTNFNANNDSNGNERSFESNFSNETELSRREEAAVTRINEDFVSNVDTIKPVPKARRTKEHSSKTHNENTREESP